MKKPLFVFELANNHMGDINHGLETIRQFKKIKDDFSASFDFAFKLQLRDPSIIHPDYVNRLDIKAIKRFTETRLSDSDFEKLLYEIKDCGFISMCTPFDEKSVEKMKTMDFDIFKVASCSFGDWPLMEALESINKPLILSTACAGTDRIDAVYSYLSNRKKDFCFLHCVSSYPTMDRDMEMGQIDFLRRRYNNLTVGFSTHELPDSYISINLAIAKKCMVFEKHVAIEDPRYNINAYSALPEQTRNWLIEAEKAYAMCGDGTKRMTFKEESLNGILPFVRGCFVKKAVKKGEKIEQNNIFLALNTEKDQLMATNLSKYSEFTAKRDIDDNEAILMDDIELFNTKKRLEKIIFQVNKILKKSKIAIPWGIGCSLSCHYGIDNFYEYGATILNILNREYCKKLIVLLPNQNHPSHFHKVKEETFHILSGDLKLVLDGETHNLKKGDLLTVGRGQRHSFSSSNGCVIEEISTTHKKDDSYYDDPKITNNPGRKIDFNYYPDYFAE